MIWPRRLRILATVLAIVLEISFTVRAANTESRKSRQAAVMSWLAPESEKLFKDFTVLVNGQAVPVYACRVSAEPFNQVWPGYQRPLDQTEMAGFAYWDMSGLVTVEVSSHRPFKVVAIRPISRGIQPIVQGQHIKFRVQRPGQFTVELDGPHHALHLFADAPEMDSPKKGDPNVLYFGAGVHRPGKIQLQSGQTVYIAGGAVVYTAIEGREVSNVRILGRGIIDTSEFARGQGGGSIHLEKCSHVKVDGVIIRDSDLYGLSAFGSRDLNIANVKLVGFWRYNTDGIDLCNTQNVSVRNSFIRSFDDSMVLKGVKGHSGGARPRPGVTYDNLPLRNIQISGLVIWCDWGRSLEIGAETSAPEMAEVAFRDIDIIRSTHIAMDIQHGDRAAIHNIRFENIRVEMDDFNLVPRLQKERDEKYTTGPDTPAQACSGCATTEGHNAYLPNLMVIFIRRTRYSQDQECGTVRDVTFQNISVTGKEMPPSSFTGYDTNQDVRGVSIQNLRFNGREITNATEAKLRIGSYVKDVHFKEGDTKP